MEFSIRQGKLGVWLKPRKLKEIDSITRGKVLWNCSNNFAILVHGRRRCWEKCVKDD